MKSLFFLFAPVAFLSASQAFAAKSPCYSKAEQAVERFAEKNYYDKNGFTAYKCDLAPNQAAVICEVSASKGQGAATDTFRVVLNRTCSKKYRVEMIGEE